MLYYLFSFRFFSFLIIFYLANYSWNIYSWNMYNKSSKAVTELYWRKIRKHNLQILQLQQYTLNSCKHLYIYDIIQAHANRLLYKIHYSNLKCNALWNAVDEMWSFFEPIVGCFGKFTFLRIVVLLATLHILLELRSTYNMHL